ncbi:MAG: hypothetical protein AB1758_34700, partial [Candidatus Eremiobacterota bacterium]
RLATCRDAEGDLNRLHEVSTRLRNPVEPALSPSPLNFRFSCPGLEGELRFLPQFRDRSPVRLLHRGVELETRQVQPLAWPYEAVVQSERLRPEPSWRSIRIDKAWQEVVDRLREAEVEAYSHLAARAQGTPWADCLLRALIALPDRLADSLADRPLFPTASGRASLRDLRGRERLLWCRNAPRVLPAETVLVLPDPEPVRALLAPARLEPYSEPRPEPVKPSTPPRRATPIPPPPSEAPRLGGQFRRRAPLTGARRGEVGLFPTHGAGGWLELVGRKRLESELPAAVAAIVEDGSLHRDLRRDRKFRSILEAVAAAVAGMARPLLAEARAGSPDAWSLLELLRLPLPEEFRRELRAAHLVPLLGEEPTSLTDLEARLAARGGKTLLVADPSTRLTPLGNRPVVPADADQRRVLGRLMGRAAEDDRLELERDAVRRANLEKFARLEVSPPRGLVSAEVAGRSLRGHLAVGPGRILVVRQGTPVGKLTLPPLTGWVEGDPICLTDLCDAVELDRHQREDLRQFTGQMMDLLAARYETLDEPEQKPARASLLEYVRTNRRELGGRGPAADLLARIAQLPLIPAAGNRMATLAAILEEHDRLGKLVHLTRPGPPEPGLECVLPVLRPGSKERELFEALCPDDLQHLVRKTALQRSVEW